MLHFVGGNCRRICGRQNPLMWQNRFYDLYDSCEDKTDLSHSMHKMKRLAGTPVSGRLQNKLSFLKISFQGARFSREAREPHRPVGSQTIRLTVCWSGLTRAKKRAIL